MIDGKNNGKKRRPPELEDQPWFPDVLRAYQMAFLSTLDRVTRLYSPVNQFISGLSPNSVLDLASGSGESALRATEDIGKSGAEIVLSDKFPLAGSGIKELDVLNSGLPPADLYTMFNAFHHFDSQQRVTIALKATKVGNHFLVVEPLRPKVDVFFKVLIATFVGPILLAPFMRPFSMKWLLLTYLFPLGILVTAWDGLVSVTKSLGKREWNELETQLIANGRKVEQGLLHSQMTQLKYFLVR